MKTFSLYDFFRTVPNMVKLFAMSVLYKGPNDSTLLKSAFELQSFGYFQRKSVQEFMEFVTKTIVERTASAARQSVKEKGLNVLILSTKLYRFTVFINFRIYVSCLCTGG